MTNFNFTEDNDHYVNRTQNTILSALGGNDTVGTYAKKVTIYGDKAMIIFTILATEVLSFMANMVMIIFVQLLPAIRLHLVAVTEMIALIVGQIKLLLVVAQAMTLFTVGAYTPPQYQVVPATIH